MRALELAKVAAAAETLRLKRFVRRQGIRVALGAGAVVFGLALVVMIHVLGVVLLAMVVNLWIAVLLVLIVDLVIAAALGSLAFSGKPDRIELEAAVVRRQSLAEAKNAATSLATIGEVAGLAFGMTGKRRAQSSKIGKAWMIADLASRFVRRR